MIFQNNQIIFNQELIITSHGDQMNILTIGTQLVIDPI